MGHHHKDRHRSKEEHHEKTVRRYKVTKKVERHHREHPTPSYTTQLVDRRVVEREREIPVHRVVSTMPAVQHVEVLDVPVARSYSSLVFRGSSKEPRVVHHAAYAPTVYDATVRAEKTEHYKEHRHRNGDICHSHKYHELVPVEQTQTQTAVVHHVERSRSRSRSRSHHQSVAYYRSRSLSLEREREWNDREREWENEQRVLLKKYHKKHVKETNRAIEDTIIAVRDEERRHFDEERRLFDEERQFYDDERRYYDEDRRYYENQVHNTRVKAGLGLAAAALAVGAAYARGRSRHRGNGRSRSSSRSRSGERKSVMQGAAAAAATTGLVQHMRHRSTSRHRSLLTSGAEMAAAALAGGAATKLFQGKSQSRRRRSRSRSGSRTRTQKVVSEREETYYSDDETLPQSSRATSTRHSRATSQTTSASAERGRSRNMLEYDREPIAPAVLPAEANRRFYQAYGSVASSRSSSYSRSPSPVRARHRRDSSHEATVSAQTTTTSAAVGAGAAGHTAATSATTVNIENDPARRKRRNSRIRDVVAAAAMGGGVAAIGIDKYKERQKRREEADRLNRDLAWSSGDDAPRRNRSSSRGRAESPSQARRETVRREWTRSTSQTRKSAASDDESYFSSPPPSASDSYFPPQGTSSSRHRNRSRSQSVTSRSRLHPGAPHGAPGKPPYPVSPNLDGAPHVSSPASAEDPLELSPMPSPSSFLGESPLPSPATSIPSPAVIKHEHANPNVRAFPVNLKNRRNCISVPTSPFASSPSITSPTASALRSPIRDSDSNVSRNRVSFGPMSPKSSRTMRNHRRDQDEKRRQSDVPDSDSDIEEMPARFDKGGRRLSGSRGARPQTSRDSPEEVIDRVKQMMTDEGDWGKVAEDVVKKIFRS